MASIENFDLGQCVAVITKSHTIYNKETLFIKTVTVHPTIVLTCILMSDPNLTVIYVLQACHLCCIGAKIWPDNLLI